jgi:arginase
MARTSFLGAPADSVGRGGGAELAPSALRELGILEALAAEDAGDLEVGIRDEGRDPQSGLIGAAEVLAATVTIRAEIAARVGAGERPFLAGGCCSVLPGALAGARDALGSVALFHFDGHLDLYDGETSPTGEAADMPVSVALGLGPAAWVAAAGGASVSPERTAQVGFRDRAESLEYGMRQPESLEPAPIQHSAEDLRAGEPGPIAATVAAILAERAPLWLHFDVDVLDREAFRYRLPDAGRPRLGAGASCARGGRRRAAARRPFTRLLQPGQGPRPCLRQGAGGGAHRGAVEVCRAQRDKPLPHSGHGVDL